MWPNQCCAVLSLKYVLRFSCSYVLACAMIETRIFASMCIYKSSRQLVCNRSCGWFFMNGTIVAFLLLLLFIFLFFCAFFFFFLLLFILFDNNMMNNDNSRKDGLD